MTLREQFVASGNWLFRRRGVLPLVMIGLLPLGLAHSAQAGPGGAPTRLWGAVCLGISLCGLGLRIVTVGSTPSGTSGRNTRHQRAAALNTTGVYSLVRHPLYLGNGLVWLGIMLFVRNGWMTAVGLLLFWLYYERIMFAEEEFLAARFGEEFERWAKNTPAFIPRLRGWKPSGTPFSLRKVLRREYSALLVIAAAFTLLDAAGRAAATGRLELDPAWGVLFLGSLAVYVVLRTLKKRTRLFASGAPRSLLRSPESIPLPSQSDGSAR